MLYFRLWRRFATIAFVRLMEYRFRFFVGIGTGLAELALAVLTFLIVYQFTDEVAGWSRAQVLLLTGIYRDVDGLISLQIAPNMQAISGYIREGEMDFILLGPVSSRFLVSTRQMGLTAIFNIVAGLALAIYAGNLAGVQWSVTGVMEATCFPLCGLLLLCCLWFFIVTFSFWLVQVDTLDSLFYSLFETARYPVSFFKGLLRGLLTFAFPVAFATTFPAQALLGGANPAYLPFGILLAALALVGTHRFWNYAVRHYSSASS